MKTIYILAAPLLHLNFPQYRYVVFSFCVLQTGLHTYESYKPTHLSAYCNTCAHGQTHFHRPHVTICSSWHFHFLSTVIYNQILSSCWAIFFFYISLYVRTLSFTCVFFLVCICLCSSCTQKYLNCLTLLVLFMWCLSSCTCTLLHSSLFGRLLIFLIYMGSSVLCDRLPLHIVIN